MKYIISAVLLLAVSFNSYALNCELTWDMNPPEELTHSYNIYEVVYENLPLLVDVKERKLVATVEAPQLRYDFLCDFKHYAISSVNALNESPTTASLRLDPASITPDDVVEPTAPSGYNISIINNGILNINL